MKNTTLLILLSLFIISCGEDNPVSGSNEIDVDWFLVKSPNIGLDYHTDNGEHIDIEGIGYFFYYTGSSNLTDINLEEVEQEYRFIFNDESNGILSFSHNGQNYSFDLSDSYDSESQIYIIKSPHTLDSCFPLQRVIYNQDMGYFTMFCSDGFFGLNMNSLSPNELIDYR